MTCLCQWIFKSTVTISLLLCIAIIALWVRSYRRIDVLDFYKLSPRYDYRFTSNVGIIEFDRSNFAEDDNGFSSYPISLGPDTAEKFIHDSTEVLWSFKIGPFVGGRTLNGSAHAEDILLDLPDWAFVILLMIPPALWQFHRRKRTPAPGHCTLCGYDLRATPTRCPECGTTPQNHNRSKSKQLKPHDGIVGPPPTAVHPELVLRAVPYRQYQSRAVFTPAKRIHGRNIQYLRTKTNYAKTIQAAYPNHPAFPFCCGLLPFVPHTPRSKKSPPNRKK